MRKSKNEILKTSYNVSKSPIPSFRLALLGKVNYLNPIGTTVVLSSFVAKHVHELGKVMRKSMHGLCFIHTPKKKRGINRCPIICFAFKLPPGIEKESGFVGRLGSSLIIPTEIIQYNCQLYSKISAS